MAYKRISPQPVVEGGTGAQTFTSHSLLLGQGTSAVTALGAATNGQIAIGSTGADPVLAGITAGTGISVSNGAGTITVSSSAGLLMSTTQLTSSQVKNLHATPITAIAAPSAGQSIWPIAIISRLDYGGSNVFTAGASQFIALFWTAVGNNNRPFNAVTNAVIVASANTYYYGSTLVLTQFTASQVEAQPMVLYNNNATEISGNAAGNNTITVQILYTIVTL